MKRRVKPQAANTGNAQTENATLYLWSTTMVWFSGCSLLQRFQKWKSKRQLHYKAHIHRYISWTLH